MKLLDLLSRMFQGGEAAGGASQKGRRSQRVAFEPCSETGARAVRPEAPASMGAAAAIVVDRLEARTMLSVPNGPFGVAATVVSSSSISLAWYSNSGDETGFIIERNGGAGYQIAGTVGAGTTSWGDANLSPSTPYTYRVYAYNAGGASSYSGEASATTPAGAVQSTAWAAGDTWSVPNGPFGLSAAAGGAGIQIGWYGNSNNELGFKVERMNGDGSWTNIATTSADVTSYTDGNVSGGVTYTYRVYAFNNGGNSSYAGPASAAAQGTAPAPVINFKPFGGYGSIPNSSYSLISTPTKTNTIRLSWNSNSKNEGGFVIERKTGGAGFAPIAVTGVGQISYTDTNVAAGTQYVYRIAAFNAAGLSNYTNELATSAGDPVTGAPASANFFSIGAYLQPIEGMDKWKARGINTLWAYQSNQDWLNTWIAAAESKGFKIIRNARTNPASDVDDPGLLAYLVEDEPDIYGISPDYLKQEYNALKAANPSIPVLMNVSAGNVINMLDAQPDDLYRKLSQAADWMSSDVYPLSTYSSPDWIDLLTYKSPYQPQWDRGPANPGNGVEVLRTLNGGKHQIAFIETSRQNIASPLAANARPPTPDEFRGEVWDSIVHGAKGVCYFPFAFPTNSDGTPADVAAEMTKQNALMTQMGPVITSFNDAVPQEISGLPKGIEGMWRTFNGHTYYFLLNMSHTAQWNQKITLPGVGSQTLSVVNEGKSVWASGGTFNESFGAYQVHIYET